MKNGLSILLFTVLVTAFYNYVGHLVPQKRVDPPEEVKVSGDMTTEQMVEAGRSIVEGKGTCLTCHNTPSGRFPSLEGIGARAGTSRKGLNDVEYLAESLYKPNDFIVEPFAKGMTAVNKAPIRLTDKEILTVMAYLQSLGGTPTVTMATKLKYQSVDNNADAGAEQMSEKDKEEASAGGGDMGAEELLGEYGCMACHSFKSPDRLLGPSLFDVGKRLKRPEMYESLMDPDATITEGFPPGVMGATLNGNGFYDKVTTKQLKVIVDYLSSLEG